MKFLIKALFLILLGFLFFCVFFIKISLSSLPYKLPRLYTERNYIIRADTKEKVQLKGVSLLSLYYGSFSFESFLPIFEKLKTWKINLLGIYINPDIGKNFNNLDLIVNWAEENYIYVYIMPKASNLNSSFGDLKIFPSLMAKLAQRYSDKNNVIYGFWGEPNDIAWSQWLPAAKEIAEKIIEQKPGALMLMTGTNYSREFDLNNIMEKQNIVLDFHDYPAADSQSLKAVLLEKNFNFFWDKAEKKYPILIGEFGGVWEKDFGEEADLKYIQIILDEANRGGFSYSAYTIDDNSNSDLRGLDLINWQTKEPTLKGQLIKNDLEKYPATDFSKQ